MATGGHQWSYESGRRQGNPLLSPLTPLPLSPLSPSNVKRPLISRVPTDYSKERSSQFGPDGFVPEGHRTEPAAASLWNREVLGKKVSFWCLYVLLPIGVIFTVILLVPVMAAIANHALHTAKFDIQSSNITGAGNSSFALALRAKVSDTGVFPASLEFHKPIDVYWTDPQLKNKTHLGHFAMARLSASGGNAKVNELTNFNIDDQAAFTLFAKKLVSTSNFTWHIQCSDVRVKAFNFLPVYKPLQLEKDIVISGLNNLPNITLIDVQLPGDDPNGGIQVSATAMIVNPSPFGMEIGTLCMGLYYDDVFLGPMKATGVNLTEGSNILLLNGRILPHYNNATALDRLGVLFTNYINSVPSTVSIKGINATRTNGDVVGWLSQGISSLTSSIAFVPPQQINPIKGIVIQDISLAFHKDRPWSPTISSKHLLGTIALPFGFSIDITQLATQLSIEYEGATVSSVTGSYAAATTNVTAQSSQGTYGTIALTLPASPMTLPNTTDSAKTELANFEKALVNSKGPVKFVAQGSAKALTNTPIGKLVLDGIKFNVTSGLIGLNGLQTYATVINAVDVTGGTRHGITLAVNLTMVNPSNLKLSVGDVTFHLIVGGAVLGTATLYNTTIRPGRNDFAASVLFDPNSHPSIGAPMLSDFISGKDTEVTIGGFAGSSSIPSLAPSLETLRLSSTLPSLHKMLVTKTVLVIPKDISRTGIAYAFVQIANPFASAIDILRVQASANFDNMTLGTINQDLMASKNTIHSPGKTTSLSHGVPIKLNLEAAHLIRFIEAAADKYNVSLGPLPPFFQQVLDLKDTKSSVTSYPDTFPPTCRSGKAFDIDSAVLDLLKPLTASIPLNLTLKMGEYTTSLQAIQQPVPVKMDKTSLYLIGPAAAPLIQLIVDQSALKVNLANATNLVDTGFDVSISGSLLTKTPADAYIEFPDGVTVQYRGVDIATLTLSPLCVLVPDGIPSLASTGHLKILEEQAFEDFSVDLLTKKTFDWVLHTTTATVRTLGIIFSNVNLNKTVTLNGLNGLPGLSITSFSSPGDAAGLIKIAATTSIRSQASLGVQLDYATFDLFFEGTLLGSIQSDKLFLAAHAVTVSSFLGVLNSQANSEVGLAKVGVLFSRYLAGADTILTIRGASVKTRASGMRQVGWLSNSLQRFSTNVTLPGKAQQVLQSIQLSDLTVTIDDSADPNLVIVDNKQTISTFANPFGFHLQPLQVKPSIVIIYNGVRTANLTLSTLTTVQGGTSSGPKDVQKLAFGFQQQTLVALDRVSFDSFLSAMANTNSTTFTLTGSTDVVAKTQVGNVAISGVKFTLSTSMKGINSFGGVGPVSSVVVNDPRPEYLGIQLLTELDNPSTVSIITDHVSLPVYGALDMTYMGLAVIPSLSLFPGKNLVPTTFQLYISNNDTKVQNILTAFIQPRDFKTAGLANKIPLVIQGNLLPTGVSVSPYPPLQEAMSNVRLESSLVGLGARIVVNVRVYIPLALVVQALGGILNPTAANASVYAYGYIDAVNDLPVQLEFVQLDTSVSNTKDPSQGVYSRLSHTFTKEDPFILPAADVKGQPSVPFTTSPMIPHMLLTKGLLGSLSLVPNNVDTSNVVQANLVGPNGTFFLPGLHYKENDVNTTYYITNNTSGDNGGLELNQVVGGLKGLLSLLDGETLTSMLGNLTDLNPSNPGSITNTLSGLGQGIASVFTGKGANGTTAAASTGSNAMSTRELALSPSSPIHVIPIAHRRRKALSF
ncbi:hypothetical protein CBS101457_003802 [Exobasidium rhododendri]|nr:hypothetical protein CBS101457_003802 [Exobasidium rhododendri]